MNEEECYYCGCCEFDGWCVCNNVYINNITECNISEEEKWKNSCWNINKDECK